MPGRVNGFSLAYTAAGAVIMWSGIKGETISSTFRGLLSGKAPGTTQEPISASSAANSGAAPGLAAPTGDTGASSATAAANQAIGKLLAAPYGWSIGGQWDDLLSLWNQESGWSNTAQNPTSEAYGVAQANPYTKMPQAGWPPADGGSASATTQISWGLGYIKSTYGSPANAWAHEESAGWY